MTPTLEALARKLAANPRWGWLPGMAAIESAVPGMALTSGRPMRVDDGTWIYVGIWIPDLSDPLTAAGLPVLAREVSGEPEAVALRGEHGWSVWSSSKAQDWFLDVIRLQDDRIYAAPPMTGLDSAGDPIAYPTELDAWVAVILGAA